MVCKAHRCIGRGESGQNVSGLGISPSLCTNKLTTATTAARHSTMSATSRARGHRAGAGVPGAGFVGADPRHPPAPAPTTGPGGVSARPRVPLTG